MHLKFIGVKSNQKLIIPFKGLKSGEHTFEFDIDDHFFSEFEESEISNGKVHVEVILIKQSSLLQLKFNLKGIVRVICDRCLDDLDLPIDYQTNLFIKFGEETEEQTEEIMVLSYGEHEIDVSQLVYEYAHLSLPYRRVHPENELGESTCNQEMLKKLDDYLISEKKEDHDPRWDNLNNLINNN